MAKTAKNPEITASPKDHPNLLMSKRGIHVLSSPIIIPKTVTETVRHAAESKKQAMQG